MKAAKYIVLIIFCFVGIFTTSAAGISGRYGAGGWLTVTSIGNCKYVISCNRLLMYTGYKDKYGNPTHNDIISSDTNTILRLYDSAGNYVKLNARWYYGYYYSQKDTSNQLLPLTRDVVPNKYYCIVSRCTLDLQSTDVKSKININSPFLDFVCDFCNDGANTWAKMHFNVDKVTSACVTTRIYLNDFPVNEALIQPTHIGFSKFLEYSSINNFPTNYYNPGFYGKYGDSVKMELIMPQTSIFGPITLAYHTGYSPTALIYSYCLDSSNTCMAKPNANPPQGFYFNPVSADMVFTACKYSNQVSQHTIRAHQYRKNSSGKWVYLGFTTLTNIFVTSPDSYTDPRDNGTLFPTYLMPNSIDLCEGDSQVVSIKTSVKANINSYTAEIDGNYPRASLTTDYSTGNSTPTFKIKVLAKNGDYSSFPGIVTLRVHADSNWEGGEAARSAPVYVHKPLSPEIIVTANGCNNLKAIIKTVNTDVGVKPTWSVHRGSLSSPAIYTSTDNMLNFTGLQQDKYYVKCFVVPFQSTCKCTGKWAIDSLDMKKLWPNLDFTLNRNTVCLKDSTKVYFAKDVKGFKGSTLHYQWDADSMIALKDTFVRNFKGTVQMNLRIYDDSGCDYSKTFSLPVDPVHALDVTPQVLQCGRDTLTLAAYSKSTHSYWYGKYSVKDAANTVVETRLDSIFKYYFSQPQNTVQSEFYSDQGCYQSYQTTVTIDTTTIRTSNANLVLCKQMKQFDLLNLQATPKGGNWSNNISGNNNIVRLDTFTAYPYRLPIQYEYQNTATQCHFAKEDTLLIWDTVRLMLKSVPALCFELKYWDAAKQYGLTTSSKGRWVAQKSPLKMDSMGMVEPRASRSKIHALYFVQTDNQGCIEWYKGEVEIAEPKLQLKAQSDVVIGYAPLKVSFTGSNTLLNSTQYFWDFGVKATTKDTATGGVAKYTYSDTGRYLVKFMGKVQGCWDTITLPIIQVGSLGTQALKVESGLKIYPNPTKAGGEATLVYWKNASVLAGGAAGAAGSLGNAGTAGGSNPQRSSENGEIQIINAIGQRVAVYPTTSAGNGEIQIALPQSGVYFITANWLLNAAIWVLE